MGGEPGEADKVARLILEGKSKLVGDSTNGIGVEDEDPKDVRGYLKDVRFIYAGRVRIKNAWYRPYAEVTLYGAEDGHSALRKFRDEDGDHPFTQLKKIWRERTAHHCEEGQIVVEVRKPGAKREQFVIFEPVGEPPIWMKGHRDASAALADFLEAGRHLDEIHAGYDAEYAGLASDEDGILDAEATLRARDKAREEDEDRREQEYLARCAEIGARVRAQSGDDVFILKTKSGREIRVPRAPFMNWALGRTSLKHLAPKWDTIAPSGMKLDMDDPYHTDWMLGAGLDLSTDYRNDDISIAAHDEMFRLQSELGEFEAAVLLPGRGVEVSGVVGKHITVVPNLDEEHSEAVRNALIVVSETGGPLAHCALFAIEREIPIFLIPDAVHRFPPGTHLTLNPNTGSVTVKVKRR